MQIESVREQHEAELPQRVEERVQKQKVEVLEANAYKFLDFFCGVPLDDLDVPTLDVSPLFVCLRLCADLCRALICVVFIRACPCRVMRWTLGNTVVWVSRRMMTFPSSCKCLLWRTGEWRKRWHGRCALHGGGRAHTHTHSCTHPLSHTCTRTPTFVFPCVILTVVLQLRRSAVQNGSSPVLSEFRQKFVSNAQFQPQTEDR